jgi:hypothetical protein
VPFAKNQQPRDRHPWAASFRLLPAGQFDTIKPIHGGHLHAAADETVDPGGGVL